jgi:hypothetical protein
MEENGGDREGMAVSNLEASSFSQAHAVAGYRITRSKFLVTITIAVKMHWK